MRLNSEVDKMTRYECYLMHSAKGSHWKKHKYIDIINGRYIYRMIQDYRRKKAEKARKKAVLDEKKYKTASAGYKVAENEYNRAFDEYSKAQREEEAKRETYTKIGGIRIPNAPNQARLDKLKKELDQKLEDKKNAGKKKEKALNKYKKTYEKYASALDKVKMK